MIGTGDEAARKTIHVALSLVAAAVVIALPPVPAAAVLAGATAIALAVELARRTRTRFARWFHRRTARLVRDVEARRLTGATTLSLGYTLAATLFPGTPALAGILVAGVADAGAAVVGKRLGRVRYPGGKSLEGSAVFFALVLLLGLASPDLAPATAVALALALTIVEAPTLPIADNLYLPVLAAWGTQLAGVSGIPTFFS